jgi:CBS domain-containing protein
MTLYEILKVKGAAVFTVGSDMTVADAAQELVRRNVGCLVVCSRDLEAGEQLLGILSERDILRFCAAQGSLVAGVTVAEVMTPHVVVGSPQDSVESTMGLMTTKRIRHLPVVAEGRLVGLVSIGDVVKWQHDHLAMENQFMKDYLTG